MKRKFGGAAPEGDVVDFGYQSKLAAVQHDPSKTRVLIGDRYVRVDACEWETEGRRCQMASSVSGRFGYEGGYGYHGGYCPWHVDCLSYGAAPINASNPSEFKKWLDKTERWSGDFEELWEKVMGVKIWPLEESHINRTHSTGNTTEDKKLQKDTLAMIQAGLTSHDIPAALRKLGEKYPAENWIPKLAAQIEYESKTTSFSKQGHDEKVVPIMSKIEAKSLLKQVGFEAKEGA